MFGRVKKRIMSTVLAVCLALTIIPAEMVVYADESDPYADFIKIYTIADLDAINNDLTAKYVLMNDIDMTEATAPGGEWDSGGGWKPIGGINDKVVTFKGEFDGNGHSIIGMHQTSMVSSFSAGLNGYYYYEYFGGLFAVSSGLIHDVYMRNCKIDIEGNLGSKTSVYIGTIVGSSVHGLIKNVSSDDGEINVNVNVSDLCVGGVVGSGSAENCYNTSHINNTGSGSVGGVVGFLGEVINCYNAGRITNEEGKACGVAYNTSSPVEFSYNVGVINAPSFYSVSNRTVSSYCIVDSGQSNDTSPRTDTQMRLQSTYVGWDFDNTWVIDPYCEYPYPQLREHRQSTEKSIDTIEWTSIPSKLAYYTDSRIEVTGGQYTVYYMDGSNEIFDVTADQLSGFDMSVTGTQTVTLTHRGRKLTYQITVVERPIIAGITEESGPAKTKFVRGTAFDFSGWKLKVTYANGAVEYVDVTDDMVSGGDINTSGTQTVTCTYLGYSFSRQITVEPIKITSLEITQKPDKTNYVVGSEFDPTGMVVTAVYNNGTSKIVTDYEISGYSSEIGTHTITVSYSGCSATFDVVVDEGTVTALLVLGQPLKTQYIEGQAFEKEGLVVQAVYSDGTVKTIEDYECSTIPAGTGAKNVTISYRGVSTSVSVTVIARELQSISIGHMPDKTRYVQGEAVDKTGLVINGLYNDGTQSEITNYSLTGFNTNVVGSKLVTVIYSGKTTTFTIEVVAPTVTELVIEEPTKTEYLLGEELDLTGLVVTAKYDNGKSEVITDYTVSGFTGESGINTVVISYGGKSKSIIMIVHEPVGDWIITKEATCTEGGTKVKYCGICGEVALTEAIPANGHTAVTDPEKEPTCTESGLTEGSHCSVCHEVLTEQTTIPALGHNPSENWTVSKHADCTEKGLEEKTCTRCGLVVETRDVDPTGHTVVTDPGKAPTCTESGLTEGSHCSVCHAVLVQQQTIDPKGHTAEDDWTVTKEANCTEDGTKVKYCQDCQIVLQTETITKLGHSFKNYVSDNNATCVEDGTKTATCERCDVKDTITDIGSAAGHSPVTDKAVDATCETPGLTEGSHCKNCGNIFVAQQVVQALGHVIVVDEAVEPTCTEKGLTEGSHCSRCEKVLAEQTEVEALGHDYEAVKEEAGTRYTCSKCQDTYFERDASTYLITYELCGGTNNVNNPNVYTADNSVVFLKPVREGYEFLGWYDSESYSKRIYQISKGSKSDITVYAKWVSKTRLGGDNRYATAALVAQEAFPGGADEMILVNGAKFPDALAASSYAGAKNCPLLITSLKALKPEIQNLMMNVWNGRVKKVTIIGGGFEPAVSASLRACGVTEIKVIAGADRYETAEKIFLSGLEEGLFSFDACVVATGSTAADALSVSPWTYKYHMPIFLAKKGNKSLTPSEQEIVKNFEKVFIVGSAGIVDDPVVASMGAKVERLAGSDRYQTSVKIAQRFAEPGETNTITFAAGGNDNFPDALGGAMLAGRNNSPVILVSKKDTTNAVVYDYVANAFGKTASNELYLLGSASVLTDNTGDMLKSQFQ